MNGGGHDIKCKPISNWILALIFIFKEKNYKANESNQSAATIAHSMEIDPNTVDVQINTFT